MTTYTTYSTEIKNTTWQVIVVEGKFNYINVCKKSVIRSLGKDFKNFNEAIDNYSNINLKLWMELISIVVIENKSVLVS